MEKNNEQLIILDKCCENIEKESNSELRDSIIEAAFAIWEEAVREKYYRQNYFIKSTLKSPTESDLTSLVLHQMKYPLALTKNSEKMIIKAILEAKSGTAKFLEQLFFSLSEKKENYNFSALIRILSEVISQLEDPPATSDFSNLSNWLFSAPKTRSIQFSKWLENGSTRLCNLLLESLQNMPQKNVVVEISKADLPQTLEGQMTVVEKCVGYLWFYPVTAASVLFSVIKNGKKAARLRAEELLYDPLFISYGKGFYNYVESNKKNTSKRIREFVYAAIENYESYLDGLESARNLVEFMPNIQQRRESLAKERKRSATIQREANEKSIFAQLFQHRKVLLYGRSNFSLAKDVNGNRVPEISPLSEHYHSVEIPRLSIFDPVGFHEKVTFLRLKGDGK